MKFPVLPAQAAVDATVLNGRAATISLPARPDSVDPWSGQERGRLSHVPPRGGVRVHLDQIADASPINLAGIADAYDTYVSRHPGKDPILILRDALRRPEGRAIISITRSVVGRKLRKPIALQRPTDFECDAAAYCCNASIVFKSSSGHGGGLATVSNRERRFAQDSRGRGRRNPAHGDGCSYWGRGLSRD